MDYGWVWIGSQIRLGDMGRRESSGNDTKKWGDTFRGYMENIEQLKILDISEAERREDS